LRHSDSRITLAVYAHVLGDSAQDDKNVIRTSPWRWRSAGKLAALLTVRFCSSEGLFLAVDEPSGRNQIAIGV
jgi:hypothetical protein